MVLRRALAAILAAGLLLAVTACGDDDDSSGQTSSAEAWADEVCTSIKDWESAVSESVQQLGDFSGGSISDNLQTAVDGVVDATTTLVDQVKEAGVPDTADGAQAQQDLEDLVDETQSTIDDVKATFDGLSDGGVADLAEGLGSIATDLGSVLTNVADTWSSLQGLDPRGELRQAIDDTPSCQDIGVGSGG
ncbi:MAG: hypothetical protein IPM45_11770 [Acidimicrobiales bacterium]|nr:hypothetical protein [Acidimicrobiales bacterium]